MEQKKLNILFLSSWYPCKNNPFRGNFVERHAVSVSKYVNVFVLHVCSDDSIKDVLIERLNDKGIQEIKIYYPKIKSKVPFFATLKKIIKIQKLYSKAIKSCLKEGITFDLIHFNVTLPLGLIAYRLSKKLSIPYVITEHWTGFLPGKVEGLSHFNLLLAKITARKASLILPVSENLKKSMQSAGIKGTYKVVYNVVDTDVFKLKGVLTKRIRFLHVSTLKDEHKNISGILRTVKRLREIRQDFEMVIVGDGDVNPHIKYAKELGILDILKIEGAKPISEIAEIMMDSDVFILFSNYENLPCVISEALCCGLPVVSTDVGGINEMIDNSNGILINSKDEDSLYRSMLYVLNNYTEYDSTKIREDAINKYGYDKVGRQFFEIYNDVLNNKRIEI